MGRLFISPLPSRRESLARQPGEQPGRGSWLAFELAPLRVVVDVFEDLRVRKAAAQALSSDGLCLGEHGNLPTMCLGRARHRAHAGGEVDLLDRRRPLLGVRVVDLVDGRGTV